MTALLTFCAACGAEYAIDRADTIRGYAWWSRCPDCRGSPNSDDAPDPDVVHEASATGNDPDAWLARRRRELEAAS